jgi:hypothetical protein
MAAALVASCSKTLVQDDSETFIPFADQAFKNYCLWHFDKDEDGEISMEEAKEVKTILNLLYDENVATIKYVDENPQ